MKTDWNVIVTSLTGHEEVLLSAMSGLGDFEPSRYENVLLGVVADREQFMKALEVKLSRDLRLPTALGRAVTVDGTVPFAGPDRSFHLRRVVREMADRIRGRSYHVRVDARQARPRVHVHQLELELADALWDQLVVKGYTPRVNFKDPELVAVVEVVGDEAGVSLVDRDTRLRYRFLKVR